MKLASTPTQRTPGRVCLGILVAAATSVAILGSPAATRGDAPTDLDALLARFSELPGLSAKFREEKKIALLAVPIRSQGEIHFAPPGRLLRRITAPTPSTALIADGRLTFVADGKREEIDLESNAVVAGFVDSFRHVLAGDRAALERTYALSLEASGDAWELSLVPKEGPLQRFVRRMVLRGKGPRIETMRLVERSGDETRMEFHDVRVHAWTEARAARVFGL